eukprot:Nitzschia sp. Nitz4//scaffold5_size260463//44417//46841//NITZ4_000949-RA/size260463-processed-gene-0.365-mRNA-1//-1//CDS//3329555241//4580//frame0
MSTLSVHYDDPPTFLTDEEAKPRLDFIRTHVARQIPISNEWRDPSPAHLPGTCMMIGNKYHASNVDALVAAGVTAMLNCASGGITRLPMDDLQAKGIQYRFTNVRQDDISYPILFDYKTGDPSKHLQVAKELYTLVRQEQGRVLFFCVAGQNRFDTQAHRLFSSASLALAVLLLFGHPLEELILSLSKTRPFVMENEGFQRQLVELEAMLKNHHTDTIDLDDGSKLFTYATPPQTLPRVNSTRDIALGLVEIELLIPGLCTLDVKIPKESTVSTVKGRLIAHANESILSYSDSPGKVAKSWLVLAMFGFDDMYDFPLENQAIDHEVQLSLMEKMFGLEVIRPQYGEPLVRWTSKCRFALVIFSVTEKGNAQNDHMPIERPMTFFHKERPGAPATYLQYNLRTTHLRAWDFVTGESYCSIDPIVFSFSPDPRDKRHFMRISTSADEPVQFHAPGEGGILGMGANAIVHRVPLGRVGVDTNSREPGFMKNCPKKTMWDAAVKRHFSYDKMIASLENRSEAGLAKRIRMAKSLNFDRRVVEFYGLGVGLSSNAYNEREFKFEAMLLARYEEEFSTYTMRKFMEEYLAEVDKVPLPEKKSIIALHAKFSLIAVKVILVSLLNAFRDLTLMGVQAFDFNHMSNVLISGDHRQCRLIDIDGNSKGSIQMDSSNDYIKGSNLSMNHGKLPVHKPSLDVDLNTVLPTLVEQLILGKGRGRAFVSNMRSKIWHATPEEAHKLTIQILRENFYPSAPVGDGESKIDKHLAKVSLWFYALLKKQSPWGNWTNDIYDAMRCIDHLPIT